MIRSIFAAAVVLLAPGGAVLAWLPRQAQLAAGEKRDMLSWLADIAALSIVLPALLALWLFVAGVQVGAGVVISLYAFCALAALVGLLCKRDAAQIRSSWKRWLMAGISALVVLVPFVVWRLVQAETLVFPAWVDSVHHTLIVRKIGEYGGIPPDLSPYLSVPFYYHYGFHLVDALFAFGSGQPPARAVLWFGQAINAFAALSVYRVAYTLGAGLDIAGEDSQTDGWRRFLSWRAAFALLAALLVEFPMQMPAYYLTWGRFTLLTGLVLLGPAISAAIEIWENPDRRDAWVRLTLLTAGLCLIHYFALLLEAVFLIALGMRALLTLARSRGADRRRKWSAFSYLVVFSLVGVFLALPWVVRVWQYNQTSVQIRVTDLPTDAAAAQQRAADYYQYLGYLIGPRRNLILLAAAAVGGLLALRRSRMHAMVIWGFALCGFSLAWRLHIGPFRPDHFAIVLFFPAAILLAESMTAGAAALAKYTLRGVGWVVLILAAGLFVAWGIRDTRNVLNDVTVLATPADQKALDWVRQNTSPDARFYINSTLWQGNTYRGVDGGYWLLPETGRFSLVPPALYTWGSKEMVQQITDWAQRSGALTGCTPEFWQLVREANLNYLYLSQGKGNLQADQLASCSRLQPVYAQDGVTIFEILSPR